MLQNVTCAEEKMFSVGPSKNIGIMFLNEVVLGKEYTITSDDSSLRKAPDGYNSVVARGRTEPGMFSTFFFFFFAHIWAYLYDLILLGIHCRWIGSGMARIWNHDH